MANELRKRQVGIGGFVENNPLTDSGTTLDSAALAAITGGVASTEHMALVIDPDGDGGAPEIVHITALTDTDDSATIVREREGTTKRQHEQGTPWVHAPTPADAPVTIDTLWGGDLGSDYEFDANSSSLPSGWSWVNQSTSTYLEKFGAGVIAAPGVAGIQWRGIVRAVPAGSSWLTTAKFGFMTKAGNESGSGIVLRESGTSKFVVFYLYVNNPTVHDIYVYKWTNNTTASAGFAGPIAVTTWRPRYLRIRKNSSSSYDFECSEDGVSWYAIASAIDVSAFITPDQIGFMAYNSEGGGVPWQLAIEWFRVR